MRFNASEYTTHIFVTALYESDSKQKLLDIKKSHPNSKFIVYGPEIRYGFLLVPALFANLDYLIHHRFVISMEMR